MSKSPSLRRIQADIRELALEPSDRYYAAPLENDMFEWHFTIRGADDTDFSGGMYHGRILLPAEYPFKPPNIVFLTESGRFETHKKVCLSFSAFHPELWQPAWGIRLILEALISFLPTPADGAIGSLNWSSKERKRLAAQSVNYCCPTCGKVADLLPKEVTQKTVSSSSSKSSMFQKEIEELKRLQQMEHAQEEEEETEKSESKEPESKEEEEKDTAVDNSPPNIAVVEEKATAPTTESIAERTPTSLFEEPSKETKDGLAMDPLLAPFNETETSSTTRIQEEHVAEEQQAPAPSVPTVTAPREAATTNTTAATTPAAAAAAAAAAANLDQKPSWMADPVLNAIILVLSMICYLLIRKIQVLRDELLELHEA